MHLLSAPRREYDAFARGDLDALRDIFTEDIVVTYLARTGSQVTIEAGRRSSDSSRRTDTPVHVRSTMSSRTTATPSPFTVRGSGTVGPRRHHGPRGPHRRQGSRKSILSREPGGERRVLGLGDHATEIGSDAGASRHPSASPASELWV